MGNQCTPKSFKQFRNRQITKKSIHRQSQRVQLKDKNPEQKNQIQVAKARMSNDVDKGDKNNNNLSFAFKSNRASNQLSAFNVSAPCANTSRQNIDKTTSRYTISSGQKICHLHSNQDDSQNVNQQVFQVQDMIIDQQILQNQIHKNCEENELPTTFDSNLNSNQTKLNQNDKIYHNSCYIQENDAQNNNLFKFRSTK